MSTDKQLPMLGSNSLQNVSTNLPADSSINIPEALISNQQCSEDL